MTLRTSFLRTSFLCLLFSSALLTAADSSLVPTTPTLSQKENPGSLPVLISLERVSKDLRLTSLQKSVIAGLRNDYRAAAIKMTQAKDASSSSAAQLQAGLERLDVNYNQRALALLNPHQRLRLREVERQVLRGTLLTTPSEQRFLGLSDAQKEEIKRLSQDANKKAAVINMQAAQGKLNYHAQIIALRKNRLQHADNMMKVLTPAQLKTWKESQGAPLSF